ncbi:MAG: CcdB family protein [Pseudomonadota bacterium]
MAAIQSHFVELDTVLVAPLVTDKSGNAIDISVDHAKESFTLALSELGAVARRALGRARGSLTDHEDDIRRALDRLFSGF